MTWSKRPAVKRKTIAVQRDPVPCPRCYAPCSQDGEGVWSCRRHGPRVAPRKRA